MKLVLALVALVAMVACEDWCVNSGVHLNIRYGSCSASPAYVASPGTCFSRTDTTVSYCNGLRYYKFGSATACTESQFMHQCTCASSPPVPAPTPTGSSCSGSESNRLRNVRGSLSSRIGELKCHPSNNANCGQCTHLTWWATNTADNVGDWKPVRRVTEAISQGLISRGDAIGTFDGTYSPCGFGGHTAIFDYYDSTYDRIFVYHQNWASVSEITYTAITNFDDYYTMSRYSSSKRDVLDTQQTLADDEICLDSSKCIASSSPSCTDNEPCDDGNPCTSDDFCYDGECRGAPALQCREPEDQCQTIELQYNADIDQCECVSGSLIGTRCTISCLNDGLCLDGDCVAVDRCENRPGNELQSAVSGSSGCSFPLTRPGQRASGSSYREVVALQYLLRSSTHRSASGFTGTINGYFDSATETAVKNFQRSKGLSADGLVGSGTWSELIITVRQARTQSDQAAAVQDLLRNRWGKSITVDGWFGSGSAQAAREFQQAKGLTADAIVGSGTWAYLLNKDCQSNGGGSTGGTYNHPPYNPSGTAYTGHQTMNSRGLALLKESEGYFPCWYLDPVGLPTIGYGHLIVAGDPWVEGDCLTRTQAEELLEEEIKHFEDCVGRYITVPLTSNQYSALVDFSFNLGCGSLYESTLRRILNQGDYTGVCDQLLRWVKGDGKTLPGLVTRRKAECAMFNS